jgi:glucan biosynthesis protein
MIETMGAKYRLALPNETLGIGLFGRMIAALCCRRGNESPCGGRAAAILGALCGLLAWQSALAFNFEDVAQRARQLAAASFKPQESKLPSEV